MCKTWMLCECVSGDVVPTDGARAEGITEAGWFKKGQLENEVVYPPPIMQTLSMKQTFKVNLRRAISTGW